MKQCRVKGCTNTADPRWFGHDVEGKAVPICDSHPPFCGAQPNDPKCTCSPMDPPETL